MFPATQEPVVPTRFAWRYGGQQVHLCGSFTRWVETVPMAPEGTPGVYSVVVHLPPGYHQYKFIVDGEWRHDEGQAFMPDPLGNVNNWLFVSRPGDAPREGDSTMAPVVGQPGIDGGDAGAGGGGGMDWTGGGDAMDTGAEDGAIPPSAAAVAAAAAAAAQGGGQTAPMPSLPQGLAPGSAEEAEYSRRKIADFLNGHTVHELIPESGKVVILDTALPVRQAFHALFEQGIPAAPLYDAGACEIVGMITASDFIQILRHLRSASISESEMDEHTIAAWRMESQAEGHPPRPLVTVYPEQSLSVLALSLLRSGHTMLPVLSTPQGGATGEVPLLLHLATLSGVLACLTRYFRASMASLPLLNNTLGSFMGRLGTWDESLVSEEERAAFAAAAAAAGRSGVGGGGGVAPKLHKLSPGTPLAVALTLLLQADVSAIPIVDESGALLDMYCRSDITSLARGNSYAQLNWDEVTVSQALALSHSASAARVADAEAIKAGTPGHHFHGSSGNVNAVAQPAPRVYVCTRRDTLRMAVERLALPGVRRLVVVEPESRRVEGIVSLKDVAHFLFQ